MNAFQRAVLALTASTLNPISAHASNGEDLIFIPPINQVSEPVTTTEQGIDVISIETPVAIGTECVLTPTYQLFSAMKNPRDREEHQRLIEQWAQTNEKQLVEFASTLSTASFRAVGQQHGASAICENRPEVKGALTEAFSLSTALFTSGLHKSFPNIIKDGTGIRFIITGFTTPQTEPVNTGNIAINQTSHFNRKLG